MDLGFQAPMFLRLFFWGGGFKVRSIWKLNVQSLMNPEGTSKNLREVDNLQVVPLPGIHQVPPFSFYGIFFYVNHLGEHCGAVDMDYGIL